MSDDKTITDDDFGDDGDFGEEQTLLTKEGMKELKEELKTLKTVKRQEVADRLKEAISYGDLSENAEYEEAKNEQAFVEGRILELDKKVRNAKVITDKQSGKNKIADIGSTVTVKVTTRKAEETYTIVGSTEADPFAKKISNESPVGKALLGAKKGDTVSVKAPVGNLKYEVLKIA